MKSIPTDEGDTIRDGDTGQAGAAGKCILADGGDGVAAQGGGDGDCAGGVGAAGDGGFAIRD